VSGAKVAALGLRVRRGCTFHGLAFNINMDLEPFQRINPCGFQGLTVTQVLDLGGPSRLADVEIVLVSELARQFGLLAQSAPAHTFGAGAATTNVARVSDSLLPLAEEGAGGGPA
jgi:lipoyl(octanoyl) transferase